MPVQFFADESGTKNQDTAFVFAGLIGRAEDWASFSNRWQAVLDAPPSIKYFKMREAANPHGQFENWKVRERDKKVAALADVIAESAILGLFWWVHLRAFEKYAVPTLSRPLSNAYFAAFDGLTLALCKEIMDAKSQFYPNRFEKAELIFDENKIAGTHAKKWYPVVREMAAIIGVPGAATILPAEPLFRNDLSFPPLQAADLLAWVVRRASHDQRWKWLDKHLAPLMVSKYSFKMTPDKLESMAKKAKDISHSLRAEAVSQIFLEKFPDLVP